MSVYNDADCFNVRVVPTLLSMQKYLERERKRSRVEFLFALRRTLSIKNEPFPAELQAEMKSLLTPAGEIILSA